MSIYFKSGKTKFKNADHLNKNAWAHNFNSKSVTNPSKSVTTTKDNFRDQSTQTPQSKKLNKKTIEPCCVCLESNWVSITPCGHYICIGCLVQIPKECPICRKDLSSSLPSVLRSNSKMTISNDKKLNIFDSTQFPEM